MGARVTGTQPRGPFALYDSVTGLAFGEVFDDRQDAEDFLAYVASVQDDDVRVIPTGTLRELRAEWNRNTFDDDGERREPDGSRYLGGGNYGATTR